MVYPCLLRETCHCRKGYGLVDPKNNVSVDRDYQFDKNLAYSQIGVTFAIAVGSILIGMGVGLMTLSMGLDLDAIDKKGDTYKVFQQLSQFASDKGYILIILGVITFAIFIPLFIIIIQTLKSKKHTSDNDVIQSKSEIIYSLIGIKIKLLVIILIVFSIIEGLIILIPHDYSKVQFDYKFFTDIVLVLIPAIAGIITAWKITDRWQTKKERNEIKRKILAEYDDHTAKTYSLIGIFIDKMLRSYAIHTETKVIKEKGVSEYTIELKNESENPYNKFSVECKKFVDEYWELSYLGNRFITSLQLYYGDRELVKEHEKIVEQFGIAYLLCEKFIHVKNAKEFIEYRKSINKELEEIKNLMSILESKLINRELIFK